MKLIIHGGYHKTGSTAFQHWLHHNKEALERQGVFVPEMGEFRNHSFDMLISVRLKDPANRLWSELAAAADRGFKHAVISAEVMNIFFERDFAVLESFAAQYRPTLFFVLRHWHSFLPSRYMQAVRTGDWQTLPVYLSRLAEDHGTHPDANFALPFRRARAAGFDRLSAIGYGLDAAKLFFAEAAGISGTLRDEDSEADPVNVQSNEKETERLRLINAIVGAAIGMEGDQVYRQATIDGYQPKTVYLRKIVEQWKADRGDLLADLDAVVAAHAEECRTADFQELFDGWHTLLRRDLADNHVEDRLGVDWHGDQPVTRLISIADSGQIPDDLALRVRRAARDARLRAKGTPENKTILDKLQAEAAGRLR